MLTLSDKLCRMMMMMMMMPPLAETTSNQWNIENSRYLSDISVRDITHFRLLGR